MDGPGDGLTFAANTIGDRWTILIVDALHDTAKKFSELAERLPAVAPNILTDRLRRLERAGLVVAEPYSLRPRRVSYTLTPSGLALSRLLPALSSWAARHTAGAESRHDVCGSPLEHIAWCPTCREPADADEVYRV